MFSTILINLQWTNVAIKNTLFRNAKVSMNSGGQSRRGHASAATEQTPSRPAAGPGTSGSRETRRDYRDSLIRKHTPSFPRLCPSDCDQLKFYPAEPGHSLALASQQNWNILR